MLFIYLFCSIQENVLIFKNIWFILSVAVYAVKEKRTTTLMSATGDRSVEKQTENSEFFFSSVSAHHETKTLV